MINLGAYLKPYLPVVLRTFCYIFENRKNEKLLQTAVECLSKLVSSFYDGLNIRILCPELVIALAKLLGSERNYINTRVMGTFGFV